jgi:hypothetical protein
LSITLSYRARLEALSGYRSLENEALEGLKFAGEWVAAIRASTEMKFLWGRRRKGMCSNGHLFITNQERQMIGCTTISTRGDKVRGIRPLHRAACAASDNKGRPRERERERELRDSKLVEGESGR